MRTYGRVPNQDGTPGRWIVVSTDAKGFNDDVYLTTLVQCLYLNINESPFYANHGLPAKPSVVQQVFPDFYVAQTQRQFAQYFAGLTVAKVPSTSPRYRVAVTFQNGTKVSAEIAK